MGNVNYNLGEIEEKFANIIWENEPIASGKLVILCKDLLSWKKSTTYTMLKRLCDKEIFANENGEVYAKMTKDEFISKKSKVYIKDNFGGSLPKFLTAFTMKQKLTDKEINEIQKMIDEHKESNK